MDKTERQKLGIKKWQQSGGRATLMYCTGFGKTNSALILIKSFLAKNPDKIIKIIVPTEYLKNQWIKTLTFNLLFPICSVEIINTSIKNKEYVDLLVLDECHRYASDTFYNIFSQTTPKYVLGLSATFKRLDNREELLNKYCPICDTITVKEAIENKWLSPYREYKVLLEVDDIDVYKELNKRFLETFSFFGYDFDLAMACVAGKKQNGRIIVKSHIIRYEYAKHLCTFSPFDSRYKSTVKDINAEITATAYEWNRALQARKSFVMNHPKKIEIAKKILNSRKGKKAITFSATIQQAEKIGIGYVVHSGNTKKKNRITMEEFSELKSGVVNTAKSLDEGADIPGLNLGIILCNSSSKQQKTQRVNRNIPNL